MTTLEGHLYSFEGTKEGHFDYYLTPGPAKLEKPNRCLTHIATYENITQEQFDAIENAASGYHGGSEGLVEKIDALMRHDPKTDS